MKKEKLPAGTKVRIIGNSNAHGFEIGDVITIRREYAGPTDGFGYTAYRCDNEYIEYIVRDYDMEVVKEETLLEQAKRLYPIGTRYKTAGYDEDEYVVEKQTFEHASNGDIRGEVCKGILYRNGKWAEIVSEAKQQSYIQPVNKNTVMSTTQIATRAQLKSIHSNVCGKWQNRIEETIKLDVFADSFEIPNGLITQAFDEADKDQTALLLEIFTKPDNGYAILATGDDFEANVFEVENIVIGRGAVSKEFRGKSIIFDSSMYEAIIMPNTHSAGELDTMIVFKKK
jgi:hypothetical protein